MVKRETDYLFMQSSRMFVKTFSYCGEFISSGIWLYWLSRTLKSAVGKLKMLG